MSVHSNVVSPSPVLTVLRFPEVSKRVGSFFRSWCQCHTLKGYGTWPSTVAEGEFGTYDTGHGTPSPILVGIRFPLKELRRQARQDLSPPWVFPR